MGGVISALAFPAPDPDFSKAALLQRHRRDELIYLSTRSGYKIPAIHLRRNQKNVNNDNLTVIYSHGNAEDVGLSLSYLDYLSQVCCCNLLAYEYCGYSIAEGEPSEENCYQCIQAAYDYLVNNCTVDPSNVVLFGRSLGTGPTIDLAAKLCKQKAGAIAGCILQSPLESGGRCVLGETASFLLYYLDIFRSYEKIESLASIPVLIMHGTYDRVVPVANGEGLYKTLTAAQKELGDKHYLSVAYPPMWIPGVGHNDMPEFECMQSIAKFLKFLQERRQS